MDGQMLRNSPGDAQTTALAWTVVSSVTTGIYLQAFWFSDTVITTHAVRGSMDLQR